MTPRLWLVDDNAFDVTLLRRFFNESALRPLVEVLTDGQAVLDALAEVGEDRRPAPDLIILDINLPKLSGLEALAQIRGGVAAGVPVVVLSTSRSPEDAARAAALSAAYVRKPARLAGYDDVVGQIEDHWRAAQ